MELKDAFGGRTRVAIVVLPIVAAIGAAFLFTTRADQEFVAQGTLSIQEFVSSTSAQEITVRIDDFESALRSQDVADALFGEAPDGDPEGIASNRVGAGGDVSVSFVAASETNAQEGLEAGVRQALLIVIEAEQRLVTRQLSAADELVAGSVGNLRALELAAGAADLAEEAARRSGDLLSLRNQIAAASDPAVRAALVDTLGTKEAELQAIEEQLLPWTAARARFDLGVNSGATASLRLQQLSTTGDDLAAAPILQSARVESASSTTDVLRIAVAAGVLALLLVVAAVLLTATGTRRRETAGLATPERSDE
ncbi:MAG: hypothetical protein ACSLFI_07685 [Solirubrobacterales bacterium]